MPADRNFPLLLYDQPIVAHDDAPIVEAIAICDNFYDWRRVRAELRHRGMIVSHKKSRRLMGEHALRPSICCDHRQRSDQPI
jgi:HTH-like domain